MLRPQVQSQTQSTSYYIILKTIFEQEANFHFCHKSNFSNG